MKINDLKYFGKKVFVGIDVHKKSYVAVAICDGLVVKKWRTEAQAQPFSEQLLRFFDGARIHSAYEAGFSGFSLHRLLVSRGIDNTVVNAASIEVESNSRVKTDKRDARKIAEQLAVGRLRGIYVPTLEEEANRSLTRGREQAVRRRTSIGNQLKMKLYYLGFTFDDNCKLGEFFFKCVAKLKMVAEHRFAVDELIDAWQQEAARVKRFSQALKEQATKDNKEVIYRSAPGIGPITARILSNELGDMTRFDNERQLFSSTGLTPSEHSSGERVRKGRITRQGPPRIRSALVEAAWRAITIDQSLKKFYLRVRQNRDSKRAIVAVARKLLGQLRYCLRNRVLWRDLCAEARS